MKRFLVAALCLLCSFPAPALARGESIGMSEVIRALEDPFKTEAPADSAIADFEADFFQESRIASLDRLQRGRGRVMVKFDRTRGDRVPQAMFRWEYDQPTTQEIVSDGETIWVYLPENRQVIQSDLELEGQARPDDPVTFLTGLGNLSRDFLIGWAQPNQDIEGNYILELRPRRSSPLIQRLLLVVNRDSVVPATRPERLGDVFPLLSSTVFDPSGNTTTIEFSGVRVNRGIPDSTFRFILPAGVEVIHPSGSGMGY
jgi:outer membrane lipoprotein carrier protein